MAKITHIFQQPWPIRVTIKLLLLCFLWLSGSAAEAYTRHQLGLLPVITVSGSYPEMGKQYGQALETELKSALSILKKYYVDKHGLAYKRLIRHANLLYARFPIEYQLFIQGVARGANVSLDDAKVLNAMETFGGLVSNQTACAYVYLPGVHTVSTHALMGRNYDYPPPFDQLSRFLTVTVMHAPNKIPTAFISIAGEVYCPTCVNAKGIFLELNNGMPSGGYAVNQQELSLLASMLQVTESAASIEQAKQQLNTVGADFSLIVNVANSAEIASFEYSSSLGKKLFIPEVDQTFVSTNFFLHPKWQNLPEPTDAATWSGVTRRKNLLNLARQSERLSVADLQRLMNLQIEEGGGAVAQTIYQLIYDSHDQAIYVRINYHQPEWVKVQLKDFFNGD